MPRGFRYDPDKISDDYATPGVIRQIRLCLQELYRLVAAAGLSPSGGSSGGGGSSASSGTVQHAWKVNGKYRSGTRGLMLDGAWIVPRNCTITSVRLWRKTAGTGGQTIVDINRRHVATASGTETTLYVTQANRPTLAYNDADGEVSAVLPDITALIAGDVVTIDCDEKDTGSPLDFTLTLEATP